MLKKTKWFIAKREWNPPWVLQAAKKGKFIITLRRKISKAKLFLIMEISEPLFIFSISGAFWFKFNGNFGFPFTNIPFAIFHPFHHGIPSSSTQFISPSLWFSVFKTREINCWKQRERKLLHQTVSIIILNNREINQVAFESINFW